MPLVYHQLKSLAGSYLRQRGGDRTLQRTALVHEVFLRLVDQRVSWQNRSQFYALAAQMMRRIAIDDARRRGRTKRGAGVEKVPIELASEVAQETPFEPVDAILLDRALTALAAIDPRAAQVVVLRFFGGLTIEETAAVEGQSAVRAIVSDRCRPTLRWFVTAIMAPIPNENAATVAAANRRRRRLPSRSSIAFLET